MLMLLAYKFIAYKLTTFSSLPYLRALLPHAVAPPWPRNSDAYCQHIRPLTLTAVSSKVVLLSHTYVTQFSFPCLSLWNLTAASKDTFLFPLHSLRQHPVCFLAYSDSLYYSFCSDPLDY